MFWILSDRKSGGKAKITRLAGFGLAAVNHLHWQKLIQQGYNEIESNSPLGCYPLDRYTDLSPLTAIVDVPNDTNDDGV